MAPTDGLDSKRSCEWKPQRTWDKMRLMSSAVDVCCREPPVGALVALTLSHALRYLYCTAPGIVCVGPS